MFSTFYDVLSQISKKKKFHFFLPNRIKNNINIYQWIY